MKHKLLSTILASLLVLSGCSAPKLIDKPDPTLLEAPIKFTLEDLANRAIAALYEYDSSDNWKVEKCTNPEVDIDLNVEETFSDEYPESLVIAKGKGDSYLIKLTITKIGYEYDYADVIQPFLVSPQGTIINKYNISVLEMFGTEINDEGDKADVLEGQYGGYKMEATVVWFVDSHEDYSDNENRNDSSDIVEVSILYTKQ